MPSTLTPELEAQAIALIRGFAMDAPLLAKSGHQGTAMALAPLGHVLASRVLKQHPSDTQWPDRDRFVLSNGHASILQYSMLYLTGSGLELDDIKAFRSFESKTPGHPEAQHTAGVEVTTGPLGQGFADAVGMAIAERFLRDRFGSALVDHHTYVIAGDGCLMEGVSHEAASLAGHLGLGRLICVFDDNHITIDGPTSLAFSDDVVGRFRAYGWHVEQLGEVADDLDTLEAALVAARADARPSLLVLRSHIGHPSPDHTDDHEAHGNPFTPEDVSRTKAVMGIPDEPFWSPAAVVDGYREAAAARCRDKYDRWQAALAALDPAERAAWDAAWDGSGVAGWEDALPTFEQGEKLATRQAIAKVLGACVESFPGLVSGAADLTGNTGTKLPEGTLPQTVEHPGGRQLYFGVREHAMGCALVGMARHGGILPLGGTFFVFLDYMRPPVRLAAISRAKAVFVFSHDSVGVGEDGPTHQPVEQLAMLRATPGLQVIRPADANETVAAWRAAVAHHGPTALVLSRQGIPVCTDGRAVERGAGVVRDAAGDAALVIVATGSEVAVAIDAAAAIEAAGTPTRVVSIPSWDRFAGQDDAYQTSVLPAGVPVLAVEAAATFGWERYADDVIGIDRFGASAPGDVVLDRLGINVDHVVQRGRALVSVHEAAAAAPGGAGAPNRRFASQRRGSVPPAAAEAPEGAGVPNRGFTSQRRDPMPDQ